MGSQACSTCYKLRSVVNLWLLNVSKRLGERRALLFGPTGSFEVALDVFIKRRHKVRSSLGAGGKGRIEGGRRASSDFASLRGGGAGGWGWMKARESRRN